MARITTALRSIAVLLALGLAWSNASAAFAFTGTPPSIATDYHFIVGLKSDGRVLTTGSYVPSPDTVSGWRHVVSVFTGETSDRILSTDAHGATHVVGDSATNAATINSWPALSTYAMGNGYTLTLLPSGSVGCAGWAYYGLTDVSAWTDIVSLTTGPFATVGAKRDGTVLATGWTPGGECDVSSWRNIIAVAEGGGHSVGLTTYGSVVATGADAFGECDVSPWFGVTAIAAGNAHTVGLLWNGSVVATGDNGAGQCNVSSWRNVVQIAAAGSHTVGLTADGRVLVAGDLAGAGGAADWNLSVHDPLTLAAMPGGSSLTFKRVSGKVRFRLRMATHDRAGSGVTGLPVTLQMSRDGKKWQAVSRGVTDGSGRLGVWVTAKKAAVAYYRWSVPQTLGYAGVNSKPQKVRVK